MNAGTSDAFMSKRDTTMASSSHPSSTLNEAISIVSRIAIPLSRKMGATCLKTRRYPRTVASSAGRSSVSLGLMLSSPLSLSLTYPKPEVLDRVESRKCGPLRQERTIANHSNDGFSLLALRAPKLAKVRLPVEYLVRRSRSSPGFSAPRTGKRVHRSSSRT